MKEENKVKEQVEETAPTAEATADDFFSANQASEDMKTFISQMKRPREKVEAPPIMFPEEEEEENPEVNSEDPQSGESEEQMLNHFDYSEEHRYTAEFMLIQLDKFLAFSLSMISGSESDRYRRRKTRMEGDDYEAEILAALVKKYQMRLSLEWMFASAIVIGYAPMVEKAMADRKLNRAQKAAENGA